MRALKFFPSSDIMNASMLKNFQLKELHFEHPRDLTWWEKQFSMEGAHCAKTRE